MKPRLLLVALAVFVTACSDGPTAPKRSADVTQKPPCLVWMNDIKTEYHICIILNAPAH